MPISSIVAWPSEAIVWLCRSPRMSSSSISFGSSQLAAVLAQLGLDVVQAEAGVDLELARERLGLAGRVVEDPVLGDVQPPLDGRLAEGRVVRARAGEVLEQAPEVLRRRDPQVEADPGVG